MYTNIIFAAGNSNRCRKYNGVWPSGKAPDFESDMHWFDPSHPSHFCQKNFTGGDYMLDANVIIANNIRAELEKENKNQSDLAKEIGVSKKTMSKIMNGARAISAIELRRISECLNVTVGSLLKMPESSEDTRR